MVRTQSSLAFLFWSTPLCTPLEAFLRSGRSGPPAYLRGGMSGEMDPCVSVDRYGGEYSDSSSLACCLRGFEQCLAASLERWGCVYVLLAVVLAELEERRCTFIASFLDTLALAPIGDSSSSSPLFLICVWFLLTYIVLERTKRC